MLKEELEARTGEVSQEVYDLINFVYMYHPSIDYFNGKQQVATLYNTFGITIFRDMYARAARVQDLEKRIHNCEMTILEAKKAIAKNEKLIKDLKNGGDLVDNEIYKDALVDLDNYLGPIIYT